MKAGFTLNGLSVMGYEAPEPSLAVQRCGLSVDIVMVKNYKIWIIDKMLDVDETVHTDRNVKTMREQK